MVKLGKKGYCIYFLVLNTYDHLIIKDKTIARMAIPLEITIPVSTGTTLTLFMMIPANVQIITTLHPKSFRINTLIIEITAAAVITIEVQTASDTPNPVRTETRFVVTNTATRISNWFYFLEL